VAILLLLLDERSHTAGWLEAVGKTRQLDTVMHFAAQQQQQQQ
jgi:hypothetical protein